MAKTSLIWTSTEQTTGKTLQKTITDVNPDASSEAMLGFVQRLNALTTNVYGKTDRVDKVNVDTESAATLITPTLTINGLTDGHVTIAGGSDIANKQFFTNSDGGIYANKALFDAGMQMSINYHGEDSGYFVSFSKKDNTATLPVTFTMGFAQTATYKGVEWTVTITE